MQATLTSKGQVTLPKALREKLSLSAGDRVEFIVDDEHGARLVDKHAPISRLKGMLTSPKQPVSLAEMDRALQEGGSGR